MVRKSRCVVIGAGEIADYSAIAAKIKDDDFIICADGGYKRAEKLGVKPDIIVGDFDSSDFPENYGCEIIKLKPEKDETDLFAAVEKGYNLGYRNFFLLGCLGGRFDHTLANITLLAYWKDKNADVIIADEINQIFILSPGVYSFRKMKVKISFFAFSEKVEGLTLNGFKYPLKDYTLLNDCGLCVSNEITENACTVEFSTGKLLTIICDD